VDSGIGPKGKTFRCVRLADTRSRGGRDRESGSPVVGAVGARDLRSGIEQCATVGHTFDECLVHSPNQYCTEHQNRGLPTRS